jgi:predicted Fe-Mo cluster-binding NifX family protein
MKIAVSAYGKDLDSQLDSRFGRCSYFLVVDPDEMRYEVFKNESAILGGGAGIQSAQFIASKGVDAVITGNCGPNAVQTLAAAGIELFVGQKGTVKEVVERLKKGKLRPTGEATVDSHFGMAPEAGSGPGRGMVGGRGLGRGMGGGTGMGRRMSGGRGMGRRVDLSEPSTPKKKRSGSASKDLELETLKKKADDINRQLENIVNRINQLETTD